MHKARTLALFALLALTTSFANDHRQPETVSASQAGTWEDDCNLSRGSGVALAAQPGTPKTSLWTRTTIAFHGRACRQVA